MESEPVLRQVYSLEITSIRDRNKTTLKKPTWKTHRYFINFESRIDVELSTSNRCHSFHVDSPFIIEEISMNFPRGNSMSNWWQIDEDVSFGSQNYSILKILQVSLSYNYYMYFFWGIFLYLSIYFVQKTTQLILEKLP